MANVVVVGSQWGDEGKGKIVDWLSKRADVVVRFQGGHNAGHTLVIGEDVYKLSLLPSGIVREDKISVIGNGVVIDPYALIAEIKLISQMGVKITPQNLMIADNACLILPVHKQNDMMNELARGGNKIGTTGRGIGPAYEDKIARRAIRVADLKDPEILKERLIDLANYHNIIRESMGASPMYGEDLLDELMKIREEILQYAKPVWRILDGYRREGKRILFEGAQGIMLDVDHGTYPYVTSSSTVASQAFSGSGMGLGSIDYVLGITKAYTTRVGSGPFPTEEANDLGEFLSERGKEFGTVTGRKRRCGWFDSVMVKQAVTISGITGIALTKLDVLDGLDFIKLCTGYLIDGHSIDYFPTAISDQARVEPIYETMDGWSESTFGAKSFKDLPANAVKYIRRIEELIGAPIAILSTSPEREDAILIKDPFVK